MTSTGFDYSAEMLQHRAVGSHRADILSFVAYFLLDFDLAIREKQEDVYWFNPVYPHQTAPSGLIGSTTDLAKFLSALTLGNHSLITHSSLALMAKPVAEIEGSADEEHLVSHFGLGWFVGKDRYGEYLAHAGSGMAYVGMIRLYPEQNIALAVLANGSYLDGAYGSKVLDLLMQMTHQNLN